MAIYITSTIPGTTVDTITLSSQQMEMVKDRVARVGLNDDYARELGLDVIDSERTDRERRENNRVKVHLMDYRDMPPEWEGAFDRVVSVEMVEAVGKEFLEVSSMCLL